MSDTEYTRADAEADAAYDRKNEIEKDLIRDDPEYAWKRRVVDAVQRKVCAIRLCHHRMGITDMTEIMLMLRRIRHLEAWLDSQLNEQLEAAADAEAERKDPYAYRGLCRSDFL